MAALASAGYQSLFSAPIAAMEMREAGDPSGLLPEERLHIAGAYPKRIGEFTAGRLCARRALAEFGIVDFPLRAAADRQPLWPEAMVGSITHTDGLCAAVVGERRRFLGIGIDSEVVAPVTAPLYARICVPAETQWVNSLPAAERTAAAMLIFSVKEAFYKCQYPIVGEWLDFRDLCVEPAWRLDAIPAPFVVRPTRPIALAHHVAMPVEGRYLFHPPFVSAGIALHAPGYAGTQ